MIRSEDHIHLAAVAGPGDRNLEGLQGDGRRSLGIQNDGVLVCTNRVGDELELQALADVGAGGEGDGVIVARIPRRVFSQVGLAIEGGGRVRVAEKEKQLSIMLERVAQVIADQPDARFGLINGGPVEFPIFLANELADFLCGSFYV